MPTSFKYYSYCYNEINSFFYYFYTSKSKVIRSRKSITFISFYFFDLKIGVCKLSLINWSFYRWTIKSSNKTILSCSISTTLKASIKADIISIYLNSYVSLIIQWGDLQFRSLFLLILVIRFFLRFLFVFLNFLIYLFFL